MNPKLLVIDDEKQVGEIITDKFAPLGYQVLVSYSGTDGIREAFRSNPDLIILDIMMPELDGFKVCQTLREITDVPILMLTAKTTDEDVVKGFELGATDYVKKPFSLKELEARVKHLVSRSNNTYRDPSLLYDDGVLKLDLERRLVFVNGKLTNLTPTEYRLLAYLFNNQDSLPTHHEILANVWGEGYKDASSCLSIYIRYLREKIEPDPHNPIYIKTVRGRGYHFVPQNRSKYF